MEFKAHLGPRIEEFRKRAQTEYEFCVRLFWWAELRLMAHKYAYYILSESYISDIAYDGEEESWFIMGRALDLIEEDDTSPCVDFTEKHPLSKRAKKLAVRLLNGRKVRSETVSRT